MRICNIEKLCSQNGVVLCQYTGREKRYDDNMEAMLECVRISHSNAWCKDPMMQLKLTALLSPELCVRQQQKPLVE